MTISLTDSEISTFIDPKVLTVVKQITTGKLDEISRWDVMGNVAIIVKTLKFQGLYEPWMEEYLWTLNDCAKESL